MSRAWDSQKVQNTSTRDRPPAPPPPAPSGTCRCPAAHYVHDTTAATDRAVHNGVQRRHLPAPTDQARLGAPDQAIPRADRHQPARGSSSAPLMRTYSGSASITVCSTSRAVDSDTSPRPGTTDSIRCANPTCSPIAAYPSDPEPISPAIT